MKSLLKPLLLGFIVFILLIPLSMIESLVRERAHNRTTVSNDIAQTDTRPQEIHGPWLVVEYRISGEKKRWDKEAKQYVMTPWTQDKQMLLRPVRLAMDIDLKVKHRQRGIYRVPVYTSVIHLAAEFDLAPLRQQLERESNPVPGDVSVQVGVADARGFNSSPTIVWNGKERESRPGVTYASAVQGFHTQLADLDLSRASVEMSSTFELKGINSVEVAPSGYDSSIHMTSDWPHPSFEGAFLPDRRSISEAGFEAHWNVSAFASSARLEAEAISLAGDFETPRQVQHMGVRLFEPVDIYTLTDRATKYGLLFILLTFAAFYLFEILRKRNLHPVQYVLVGLALALFFLLLLSLSEHIGFGMAYLLATLACTGLVSFYVVPAAGMRGAAGLGVSLLALYGACYVILKLEDHALLVGALLIFLVLGGVMLATRRIDWNGMTPDFAHLSRETSAKAGQKSDPQAAQHV